ncbi:MAG: cytochrome c family protein [Pseudomonadota bacterium]
MKRFGVSIAIAHLFLLQGTTGYATDIEAGEKLFKRCVACHTIDKGGKNKVGPNLYGIVGAPVAANEDFKYSKAMKSYAGEWTPERLDAFLTNPRKEVKKTKMSFGGLKKEAQRADLIAYMNSNSDSPIDLSSQDSAEAEADSSEETDAPFGVLVAGSGAEETYNYCIACHSEMIVAQQGLTRPQWEEMMEWMVEEQGMSEIEEPEYSLIMDYLSKNYGPDRPNFPKR